MSGFSGANLNQFLQLPSKSQGSSSLSEGTLVSVSVGSASDSSSRSVTLRTGSTSKSLFVDNNLPDKSVMLGRVESTKDGMRLRLLRRRNEVRSVKTDELVKLLRQSNIDLSGRDPTALKSELMNRGYVSAGGSSPSGQTGGYRSSSSLIGVQLPVQETSGGLQLPTDSSQPLTMTVVSSGENQAQLQFRGQTLQVETSRDLKPGTQLQVTANRTGGRTVLQVEGVRNRSFSSDRLNQLLNNLGLETNDSNRTQLSRMVLRNLSQDPSNLLRTIQSGFGLESVPDRSAALESLKQVLQDFRASGNQARGASSTLSNPSAEQLTGMLKEFGIEPDPAAKKALKTVLQTDPGPSKQVAKTVMDNIGMVQTDDGQIDPNRLKSLLFLAKNDLPVKKQMVDLLQFAAPDSDASLDGSVSSLKQALQGFNPGSGSSEASSQLERVLSNLTMPEFNPTQSSNVTDGVAQVLKQLGFDLERQVAKTPNQAGQSLRANLMDLQQTLSQVATEKIQQFVESGNPDLKTESRRVLSQLFKFSMGSVAEDDSIYLFVPFPDGDETGLMKMRFQNESDSEDLDDEKWSVTINLDLSRLGALQVHAQRYEEALNLDFRAERKSTRSLLRNRSDELTEVLSERGFDVTVQTGRLRDPDEPMIDWNLYFDTDQYTGTLDVTI